MSLTESQIEAGAAALFAFGHPDVDPAQAWAFLSDDHKPSYRERVREILAAASKKPPLFEEQKEHDLGT